MDSNSSAIANRPTKADRIRAGLNRARQEGKRIGRPPIELPGAVIIELRRAGFSWAQIARQMDAGAGSVRRAFQNALALTPPCQNPPAGIV